MPPEPAEPTFGLLNYMILFAYLAVMVGIGLRLSGKQKTTEDYFLAGRKMPWVVVALSMFASLTSAITYMGVPGTVFRENTSFVIGAVVSPILAPFLVILFYPFYRRLKVTTTYEYIDRRYGRQARGAVSGLFVLARLGWLGTVIYVPALALSVVTGINIYIAIALMGILATAYTVMGGLSAVLWTDVIQFMVLIGGAILVAVTLTLKVPGGIAGIFTIADQYNHLGLAEWDLDLFRMSAPIVLVSFFLSYMQDYGTDQVTVQRLLAVKTFRGMVKSVFFNSMCDFFVLLLLCFVGLGLFAYFQTYPAALPERFADPGTKNQILPYYIMHALPQGLSGLIITGIFAAAMSSMDSGINSLSTVLVNDFIKPLRPTMGDERSNVMLARVLTLAVGAFATGVSFVVSQIEDILQASSTFLSLFAGPILALFLLGILTRRTNFWGWLVGTAVAIPATLWFQNHEFLVNGVPTKVHWTYYFPFAFGIALIVGLVASLVIGGPKADPKLTLWGRSKLAQID